MFDWTRRLNMDEFFQSAKTKWEVIDDESSRKEQTTNQFLLFCDVILKYEKYKPHKDDMNDSAYSPSSSERTIDSFSSESNSSFNSNRMSNEDSKSPNPTDSDDDSWDLITCHCMKPFAGRPMIECTVCATWIHMSCAKIRRNNIPDDFICQLCREAKGSKRRSERIRSDDRRLLSA